MRLCFHISDLGPYPSTMVARNTFRGPGAYNINVSASKSFPIYERINLELRAEAYSTILNHHNLYIQGSQTDAANYGADNPQIFASKGGVTGMDPTTSVASSSPQARSTSSAPCITFSRDRLRPVPFFFAGANFVKSLLAD